MLLQTCKEGPCICEIEKVGAFPSKCGALLNLLFLHCCEFLRFLMHKKMNQHFWCLDAFVLGISIGLTLLLHILENSVPISTELRGLHMPLFGTTY